MNFRENWKSVLVVGIGFFVVAFIGIVAGSWFVNYRSAQAYSERGPKYKPIDNCLLKENDLFPDLTLLDIDGNQVNGQDIFHGNITAVMFIEPGCDPCKLAMKYWSSFKDNLPTNFDIVAISGTGGEYLMKYLKESEFPYPVYSDTAHRFVIDYGMNGFPSVVGVGSDGKVAFPFSHIHGDFSPIDVYMAINKKPAAN